MATSSPTEQSAVRAARDVFAAVSRLRRRAREVSGTEDLTPSQTSALSLLAKNGAATASALATLEGVRPQSMATTLSALEQRGLIQRDPDPADGRRQVVTVTRAGESLFSGNRAARHEWMVRVIEEQLTERECRTLIDAAEIMMRLTEA